MQVIRSGVLIATFVAVSQMGCRSESRASTETGIELELVSTLGSPDDPASPHVLATVTAWSEGRFVVAPTYDDGTLHIYSSQGPLIGQLGGSGEGPGEFSPISIFAARTVGGTLWVATQHDPRLTGFPPEARVPQVVPTTWPVLDFVPISQDRVLLTAFGPAAPSLVLLDLTSGVTRDLPLSADLRSSDGNRGLVLGRGSDGSAWIASADSGLVAPVTPSGVMSRRFSISTEIPSAGGGGLQAPRIYALWEGDGVLWVLVSLNTEVLTGGAIDVGFMDRYFDTLILALDLETGAEVARGLDDRFLSPSWSTDRDLVSHVFETGTGDTRIEILQIKLDPALDTVGS